MRRDELVPPRPFNGRGGEVEGMDWAQEALACNMLVVAWPKLKELARQETLF